MHHSALTTPPDPPFDPAEDDSDYGWLERARNSLWDDIKSDVYTAATAADMTNMEYGEIVTAILLGDPFRAINKITSRCVMWVRARAPQRARELYENDKRNREP